MGRNKIIKGSIPSPLEMYLIEDMMKLQAEEVIQKEKEVVMNAFLSKLGRPYEKGDIYKFKKQKERKKKEKLKETYIENHPDFEYTFGYISNPPPGTCKLSIDFKNVSNEIKFIEMFSYNFEFKNNKNQYLPPLSVLNVYYTEIG